MQIHSLPVLLAFSFLLLCPSLSIRKIFRETTISWRGDKYIYIHISFCIWPIFHSLSYNHRLASCQVFASWSLQWRLAKSVEEVVQINPQCSAQRKGVPYWFGGEPRGIVRHSRSVIRNFIFRNLPLQPLNLQVPLCLSKLLHRNRFLYFSRKSYPTLYPCLSLHLSDSELDTLELL